MVAYAFYWFDDPREAHLVGILPERRRAPKRITQKSILNWGRIVIGDDARLNKIFFTQVLINEETGKIIENVH
jgi:hypothetical protein